LSEKLGRVIHEEVGVGKNRNAGGFEDRGDVDDILAGCGIVEMEMKQEMQAAEVIIVDKADHDKRKLADACSFGS